jgi:tetratricopeptide (TPR) repeat protein
MINPATLAAAERDSVCEQCHLSGEVRVPKPGKDELTFQPGGRLGDSVTVFLRAGSGARMKVTSHVEDLAQSVCKKASGASLWCGTCHDPHRVPAAAEKAAYFRSKCVTCHQPSQCRATPAARQANGDDCTACHMPRNPTSDVDHVVFTDHSIPRRKAPAAAPAADAVLAPFAGGTAGARDLGLAYAILGQREQVEAYIGRAFRLLQEAVARGEADAPALAYLAEFYRDRKDDAHALPLYEQSWRLDHTQAPVAAALGAYRMQSGHLDEAIRLWNEALAINPALLLVRANLATALDRAGHADQAQAVMRKALEFNPAFQEARDFLERTTK